MSFDLLYTAAHKNTHAMLYMRMKHTHSNTQGVNGSWFKPHCAYLSYFGHNLAHCPRFQSPLPALQGGQCLQIDRNALCQEFPTIFLYPNTRNCCEVTLTFLF